MRGTARSYRGDKPMKVIALSCLRYVGYTLIGLSVVLFALVATGSVELPPVLVANESGVHSVARVAVIGCLCAAIGTGNV